MVKWHIFMKMDTEANHFCLNKRSTKNMQPHHISSLAAESLDESFLDVGVGSGDADPGSWILFLPNAVCQVVNLGCHTAHAFNDLSAAGGIQTITVRIRLMQRQKYNIKGYFEDSKRVAVCLCVAH